MESLPQRPEQKTDAWRVPGRALLGSIGLHLLVFGMLLPVLGLQERALPPVQRLDSRLLPAALPVPRPALPPAPPPAVMAPTPLPALPAPAGGIPVLREATVPATAAVADDALDDVPDAAGLRQFRLALATEARRFRRYPDAARREGLAGTAEVRIAVLPGAQYAELSRSSGHALLDAAALDMLQQATTRTQLPESLRGRRFVVFLPVVFAVDD